MVGRAAGLPSLSTVDVRRGHSRSGGLSWALQDIALGASACTCDAAGSEVVGRAVLERGLGCAQSRDLEGGVLVPSTHSSGLLPSRGGRGKLAPAGEEEEE